MTDISKVVSEEGVNLIDMSMKMSQHLVVIKLVIGVQGITQLSRILTKLENLPNVYEAKRRGQDRMKEGKIRHLKSVFSLYTMLFLV